MITYRMWSIQDVAPTCCGDKSLRVYWRNFVKIFVSATEFCRRNKSHKFWLVFLGDLIVIFGRASPFLSYPGKSPWAVEDTDHQKSEAEWEGQKKLHYEKSMSKDAYSQKWQKYWIEVKEIHPTNQKEVTWEEETPPSPQSPLQFTFHSYQ